MNNFTNRDKVPDKTADRDGFSRERVHPADTERVANALSYKFDVLKAIGGDRDCEYYLAREIVQNHMTGLKVLSAHRARDVVKRELFYLESYAASKLSHLNIVRFGRPEEIEGIHFTTFEYKQDALSLRDLLDRSGWLDMRKKVAITDQIASALDYAHSVGVLHLNLHPGNVLVEPDGWVCVKGFGLEAGARMDWVYGERALSAATPYMSAEQQTGARVDHRSDLYSLGVILYELLTDRVPYDSEDREYVKQRQVADAPAPPHLISMDVPEKVSSVVMKLLEKDPNNRFKSAAAFQTALDGSFDSSLR